MKNSQSVLALTLLLLNFAPPAFCQLQPAKTFVYTNNNSVGSVGPNSVSAFSVGSNGALTPVPGSPFPTGGSSTGFTVTDTSQIVVTIVPGNFLYATNTASNSITGFSIDTSTGALTPIPGSPFATGGQLTSCGSLAVTPHRQFLYAGNCASSNISAFNIASNGALTPIPGSPFSTSPQGFLPVYLKVSPDSKFLTEDDFLMFSIGSDGTLTPVPGSPFAFGFSPSQEVNCGSNLLFAPIDTSGHGGVNVLQVASNGVLTPIAGSPFVFAGSFSTAAVLSPDDRHLFVSNLTSNTITSLSVTSEGGLMEISGSPFPTPSRPVTMATDQAGTLLYVASLGQILGFNIGTDGTLSPVPGSPFVTGGFPSVAVFPPKTCFGNLAARQAQKYVGGFYGSGGKGFDYSGSAVAGDTSSNNACEFGQGIAPCYIKPTSIDSRYEYFDSNPGHSGGLAFDFGMDCSGLVLWSFNTAVGATIQRPDGSPAPAKELPIWYEGAPAQCSTSQSTFLVNDVLDPSTGQPKAGYQHPLGLRPGDLLCFHYSNGRPGVNHVAMYLGNEATQPGIGGLPLDTIEDYSRTSTPSGVLLYHVDTRSSVNVGRAVADRTGTTNCKASTPSSSCFDFLGYWRPKEPRVEILWEAHSPVSLAVTEPDGSAIDANTWIVDEHEAYRAAGSLSYNDYSPTGDDMVFSPTLKPGVYIARVVPKPGAAPTDTYSLTVTAADTTITLAQNVPISEIPSQGYAVTSDGTTISVPQRDAIPPTTIDTLSPQPNLAGWNNTNVTVTLSSTDNEPGGSGVKQITYSATGAQTLASTTVNASSVPVLVSSEGTTTITFFGTDNAGNVENPKQLVVMLDKTLPSVNCGAPDGLWHASDVNIPCTASDVGSGLANPPDANFSLSTSVPAGTETSNAATGTRAVCDVAGNCATAGPVTGNKVDKKPPTISVSSPTAGGSYLLNQAVNANYTCTDAGSGVATCTGTVASGSPVGTALVGSKTFTVNATDNVGNVAPPQSVSYSVTYAVCLLYDPTRAVQSGSTIPLKIQLCDANNADVSSSTVFVHGVSLVETSTNASEVLQSSGNANSDNDFRFDPTLGPTGGYIFNLSTQGLTTGSYLLSFSVGADPFTHTLSFQVR